MKFYIIDEDGDLLEKDMGSVRCKEKAKQFTLAEARIFCEGDTNYDDINKCFSAMIPVHKDDEVKPKPDEECKYYIVEGSKYWLAEGKDYTYKKEDA